MEETKKIINSIKEGLEKGINDLNYVSELETVSGLKIDILIQKFKKGEILIDATRK